MGFPPKQIPHALRCTGFPKKKKNRSNGSKKKEKKKAKEIPNIIDVGGGNNMCKSISKPRRVKSGDL